MLAQTPSFQRFAIYYAPPAGSPLAVLGAAWLGYDAETGEAVNPRGLIGDDVFASLPMSHEALVRPARFYGFHATLKAPFRLGEGIDADTLDGAVGALAARTPPVTAPRLRVKSDLGFVALQPDGKAAALDALAASCVTGLDLLRAPLTGAELAKRRRADLDMVEDAHLRNWGYPYVLDRFRFHVTLTTQLARLEARELAAVLDDLFGPALEQPFRVNELCLFGDPGDGRPFRLVKRYALTGRPAA
jgi:putative phosphonate metabolism protein